MSTSVQRDLDIASGGRVRERPGPGSWFVPVLLWFVLVGVGVALVAVVLVAPGLKRLDAAPLHGAVSPRVGWPSLLPVAVAGAAILLLPRWQALEWRRLLLGAWGLSAVWAVALAVVRGGRRIGAPFVQDNDYLAALPNIDSIGSFLRGFVDQLPQSPIQVQGHPPGFVLIARGLEVGGLGGPVPLAFVCILAGAAAAPVALVVVRDVAGESWARRAAPFVAVSPAAIWIATSADALFSGVGALAVMLVVRGTMRRGTTNDAAALTGGVLFGVTANLSYGLVLLAVIPLAVAVYRRHARPILMAILGALPVFVGFALAGFWWLDGLFATRDRYFAGIASRRPYELFVVANLSILAIVLGPAVAVALWRLRERSLWVVVGAALAAVAVADLSGMSKSEVERIWLPFTPFVLVAAAVLVPRRARGSTAAHAGVRTLNASTGAGWLATQAGFAIVLESVVRTAW